MKRAIRNILIFGGLLVGLPILLTNLGATLLMRRRPADPANPPDHYGIAFEEVRFFSRSDKTPLVGWWIPAPQEAQGTIIICHGQNGSMDRDTERMIPLHAAGFNVLMFDFRAHGRSGGNAVTMGMYEKEDLLGALDYLIDQRGIDRVGVLGFSMGAATALITAALSERIVCIVADSPFGRLRRSLSGWWRMHGIPIPMARFMSRWILYAASVRMEGRLDQTDPIRWTVHIGPRPILFIFGSHDPFVSRREIKRMVELAAGPTEVWTVQGVGHRGAYSADPTRYDQRVVAWFRTHLAAPTPVSQEQAHGDNL